MKPVCHNPIAIVFAISTTFAAALAEAENERQPQPAALEISLTVQQREIVTFEPVIAIVSLVNRNDRPFELDVREYGAPYALQCIITPGGGEPFEHEQWIRRSGPKKRRETLAPGESAAGDVLVFLGPPTGFAFGTPGSYTLQFRFQPESRRAPVYSNTVELIVRPDEVDNESFIAELNDVAYDYFGYDRDSVRRNMGDNELIGYRLIIEILAVRGPHFIDPNGDEISRKKSELVTKLAHLFDRFPNTSYAGYVARLLGYVHIKTFEHEVSHSGIKRWDGRDVPSELEAAYARAGEAREQALRYLILASQQELWPRTAALYQLGRLHLMSEEWDKVNACSAKLRAMETTGADEVADQVEREAARYRQKLKQRKAREGD